MTLILWGKILQGENVRQKSDNLLLTVVFRACEQFEMIDPASADG